MGHVRGQPQGGQSGNKISTDVTTTSTVQQGSGYVRGQAQAANRVSTRHANNATVVKKEQPKQATISGKLVKKAEERGTPGIEDLPEPPETVGVSEMKAGVHSSTVVACRDVGGKDNKIPAEQQVKQAVADSDSDSDSQRSMREKSDPESNMNGVRDEDGSNGREAGMNAGVMDRGRRHAQFSRANSESESECDEPQLPAGAPQTQFAQVSIAGMMNLNVRRRDVDVTSSGGRVTHTVDTSAHDSATNKNMHMASSTSIKNKTQTKTGIGRELERRSPPPSDEDEDEYASRCVEGSVAYGSNRGDSNNTRVCVDGCVIEVEVKFDDKYRGGANDGRNQWCARSESLSRHVNGGRRRAQLHYDDECCGDFGGKMKSSRRGVLGKEACVLMGSDAKENVTPHELQREVGYACVCVCVSVCLFVCLSV